MSETHGGWWPVEGRSMWPLYPPMQVQLSSAEDVHVGDVIAFIGSRPGILALHRVTAIDGETLRTRGDSNPNEDQPLPKSAVIGKLAALRWGPAVLHLPQRGLSAEAVRRAGMGWARLAPKLRIIWAQARQIARKY